MQLARVVAVMALLVVAAALATPPGRQPLVLRGIQKMLSRDSSGGAAAQGDGESVPAWRRALSFILVLAALALAAIR